jgi:hypothetical protein
MLKFQAFTNVILSMFGYGFHKVRGKLSMNNLSIIFWCSSIFELAYSDDL